MTASASRRATTEPMTEEQLAVIEARAAQATPGVECDRYHEGRPRITTTAGDVILVADCETLDDARFFAAARTDVPALVAEVRRARAAYSIVIEQSVGFRNAAERAAGDYRMVRDAVLDHLGAYIRGDDIAEPAMMAEAIERAACALPPRL